MNLSCAAVYCVHNDDEWLGASLESIYDSVPAILILLGERPWNGPALDNTATRALLEKFPDPKKKITLVRGEWSSEVEQRNTGLALLEEAKLDYMFIIDADEVYDPAQLRSMFHYVASRPEVGCWHLEFRVYWKSPRYYISPPERHHPPVLLRTGTGAFVEYRNCVSNAGHDLVPQAVCICHHLSYARTDEQIRRKLGSFSHSHQIPADWFDRVWKGWDADHSLTDLCPYNPGVFERAVEGRLEELPPVLRRAVEKA